MLEVASCLQAKRTNVGIALVSNPRVLFLDEPTSGLDSYTASEVMEVVKARPQPVSPSPLFSPYPNPYATLALIPT